VVRPLTSSSSQLSDFTLAISLSGDACGILVGCLAELFPGTAQDKLCCVVVVLFWFVTEAPNRSPLISKRKERKREMVKFVKNLAEMKQLLTAHKKVVVDFTASWCGPCRVIGPKFEAMAPQYSAIEFVKVDVDDASDVAEWAGVSAMPTFKAYAGGEQVDELVGASEDRLKALLSSLSARV
jgi:thioredoxin 1